MPLAGEGFVMTDNWLKFVIAMVAVVGAFIGIGVKEIFDRIRDRKEEKRLTYDLTIGSSMTNVPQHLAAKISVEFDSNPVQGQLYEVTCTVENTGRLMVKNQYLRFSFPDGYKILDSYPVGNPAPEFGIAEVPLDTPCEGDWRWLIGQIEKREHVQFGFLVDGKIAKPPSIHAKNDEGNVELIARRERSGDGARIVVTSSAVIGCCIGVMAITGSLGLSWGEWIFFSVTSCVMLVIIYVQNR